MSSACTKSSLSPAKCVLYSGRYTDSHKGYPFYINPISTVEKKNVKRINRVSKILFLIWVRKLRKFDPILIFNFVPRFRSNSTTTITTAFFSRTNIEISFLLFIYKSFFSYSLLNVPYCTPSSVTHYSVLYSVCFLPHETPNATIHCIRPHLIL